MEKREDIIRRFKRQLLHFNDVRTALERLERKVPSDRMAEILVGVLVDEDTKIQEAAINAVEIAYSYDNVKNLRKLLLDSLSSENTILKKSVLRVFARTEFGPAKKIILSLDDKDPGVRLLAANALAEIKDPDTISRLAFYLKDDNEQVRDAVKKAIYSISWSTDERCVKEYIKLLKRPDDHIQEIVVSCLQNIQNDGKLTRLQQGLKDSNPNLRVGAAAALAKIERYRSKENIIAAYLSETNTSVKTKLGKILEGIGSAEAVTFLESHKENVNLTIEQIYTGCIKSVYRLPCFSNRLHYLNRIAQKYIHLGKRNRALQLFDEVYKTMIVSEKQENSVPVLIALIKTYSGLIDKRRLEGLLDEALEAAENTPNRLKAAEYCTELGKLTFSFGKTSFASMLLNQAIKLSHQKRKSSLDKQIAIWTDIAAGLNAVGEESRGLELLERCKEEVFRPFFEAHYSTSVFIETIRRISLGFAIAADFKQAIFLADSLNEPEFNGILYIDIGVIACEKGEKRKVPGLIAKAVKIAKNLYYPSSTAYAYLELAKRLFVIESQSRAEEMILKVVQMIHQEFEKSESSHMNILLGKCIELYILQNNISKAFSLIDSITDAMIKTKSLLHIAYAFNKDNKYTKVRKILDTCKKNVICILRSREQAPLLVKMGILYSKLGDWDTATKLVQRAYYLSVENKEKDGILAGLAPLLTEVVG